VRPLGSSWGKGQSDFALPRKLDVDLFGDREGVVDLDAEIAHRAFDLSVL
jgi:hypothetical protein